MIIMNDVRYIENYLSGNYILSKKEYPSFLYKYALYLRDKKNKNDITAAKELESFAERNFIDYSKSAWSNYLENLIGELFICVNNHKLCECNEIIITKNEYDKISSLNNQVHEKLMFTLLCLAKFFNYKHNNNKCWVSGLSSSEIFSLANINAPKEKREIKIGELHSMDLILFNNRVDNLDIKVNIVDDSDEVFCKVDRLTNLGNQYMLLQKNKKYKRCETCGDVIFVRSNSKRYCKKCADISVKKIKKRYSKISQNGQSEK